MLYSDLDYSRSETYTKITKCVAEIHPRCGTSPSQSTIHTPRGDSEVIYLLLCFWELRGT